MSSNGNIDLTGKPLDEANGLPEPLFVLAQMRDGGAKPGPWAYANRIAALVRLCIEIRVV